LVLPGADLTVDETDEINDRGEIVGFGMRPNGDRHALLLIPCQNDHADDEDAQSCGDHVK
jgi:hypothetical protein